MITFYRLWDKLNRSGLKQKDLKEILSPATINKLRKNEIVTTDTLNKLCIFLNKIAVLNYLTPIVTMTDIEGVILDQSDNKFA